MRVPTPSLGLKIGLLVGLVAGIPVFSLTGHLQSPTLRLLTIVAFLAGVTYLLVQLLVDWPLKRLSRLLGDAAMRDFLLRAKWPSRDRVGQLVQNFNQLLERITTLDASKLESERQLVSTQEELKLKSALAEKSAIIERTNQDLESRLKELGLISDLSKKVVAALDLQEFFKTLDELLGERLGFNEFALLLRHEERDEVVVQVARGFADTSKVRGMSFRSDEGLTGQVLQSRGLCYIPDTRLEPRYLYYKGEKREDGSFLSIPLLFKESVVGILNFTRPGIDAFTAQEIQFLTTIADQLAIALANARLFSKTRELAVRDELTQLYNRRHFQTIFPLEMKRAARFAQPLSLLMMDIDRFKGFNDQYGHLAGDRRLQETAQLLKSNLREVDFVARFGGEEFVVLLPSTPKGDAVSVAEKLRNLIRLHPFAAPAAVDDRQRFTVSFGVAAYPGDGETWEGLLAAADTALYQAKGKGRDRVISFEKRATIVAQDTAVGRA